MALSMEAKFSLMEVIREGLGSVGKLVSMCLQVAPHKIVQQIKIRTAGRLAVLQDQVKAVVFEPVHGPVGRHGRGRVLLHHPRTNSCYCLDPGKDHALHGLQIDIRVYPEASLKDGKGHDFPLTQNDPKDHDHDDLPRVPGLCQSLSKLVHTPAVHNSQISISLSVKMLPFLVRIMTTAHLLSASVHVTSARGPNAVAIVLRLVSVNS
jgi:hypothetical protein